MKKKELCYIVIVAVLGVSLLLSFAVEVFHLDLGGFSWTAGWVSSPIALAIGFAFALLLGKAFPDFNKTMSKKMLQYSVIGLGFGMNVDKALASGAKEWCSPLPACSERWRSDGCWAESCWA